MATTDSFRITQNKNVDSSSEEGELSSDSEAPINDNDSKMEVLKDPPPLSQPAARKSKNIWSQVLADQSSNDISSSLGTVGMKNFMSRGPESFSVEPFFPNYNQDSSDSDYEIPSKTIKTETIEEEMENYMIRRHFLTQSKKTKRCKGTSLKRKSAKKGNFPGYPPGKRVVLNKKLEISSDDSEDKVAEELTFRLWEKKKDLIKALVRCIGVERALFLYNKTELLELNGGLMTLQGHRRRTPGGTFLHLLRTDDEIDQHEVNKIFEADSIRDREYWQALKMAKKQKKAEVGRTPHNSPQMETPGSSDSSPKMDDFSNSGLEEDCTKPLTETIEVEMHDNQLRDVEGQDVPCNM